MNLDKFVGFEYDGASVMTRIRNGMDARLKDKINPFILSINCVAHVTNFASLDATNSAPYKNLSTLLDNSIKTLLRTLKDSARQ